VKSLTGKVQYEAPTWNQIYSLLLCQAQKIYSSGFKPQILVGVSRGGWIPARVLSDLLGNANLANVKAESYTGIGKAQSNSTLTQCLSADVSGKNVLVVDEIADSGKSLKLIIGHVLERGAREIKTATLYCKSCCSFKPDFFEKETGCWVIFPWEIRETLIEILGAHKADAAQVDAEIARLAQAGVSKRLLTRVLKEFSEAKAC
jgi:uncharacterized protein